MSISAAAVWEVRATGSDNNGGFYAGGGTDYSQQDAGQLSLADVVTNGTTTVTSATGGFTAAMVGNGINVAGTIYQITARASSTSITVDRNATTGTGQVGKVGGALATPTFAAVNVVAGNTVYFCGSFTCSSPIVFTNGPQRLIGYATSRAEASGRATLTANFTTAYLLQLANTPGHNVRKLRLDGASKAGVSAITSGWSGHLVIDCEVVNFPATPFNLSGSVMSDCYVGNVGAEISGVNQSGYLPDCQRCQIAAYTTLNGMFQPGAGIAACTIRVLGSGGPVVHTYSANNWRITGNTFVGPSTVKGIVSDTGFYSTTITDNLFVGFSVGVDNSSGSETVIANNAAFCSGGLMSTPANSGTRAKNNKTLTVDPLVNSNATTTDSTSALAAYALNATAGGGADCRGASAVPYRDIGAVQSQATGGTTYTRDALGDIIDPTRAA